MEMHTINTVPELSDLLGRFGSDVLFRGQVQNYGSEHAPSLNTSFRRQGCIPPIMLRWSHYSRFLLSALLGVHEREISIELSQAILQHYGWRSFYLDATAEPAVAAWFAAHTFSSKNAIELCEDCFEEPVFLAKLAARYDFSEGDGYIYVLSKAAIQQCGLTVFDLTSIPADDCRPRFLAQRASLVGVLHHDLPKECFVALIKAPRAVLREFAAAKSLKETFDLFPRASEDPILATFLSLPWLQVRLPNPSKVHIDFFRQPIELPEYDDSFRKINPSHVAMYRHDFSADHVSDTKLTFYDAPEDIIFGTAQPVAETFPKLTALVRGHGGHVVFEIDNLVRRPGIPDSEYVKGLAVQLCDDGRFCVADFAVDYQGQQMGGCGINMGWFYELDAQERWRRVRTAEDCTCGNDSIHEHHLSGMTIIEHYLSATPNPIVLHRGK